MPVSRSPQALNPNLSGLEKRIQWSWHAVKKIFTWEIIVVMVQMMDVRFGIQKTPFSGQLTLKKWLIE
jgi:hypothetical protein